MLRTQGRSGDLFSVRSECDLKLNKAEWKFCEGADMQT